MNDTSPEIRKLHQSLLMERSGEERFLMGVSMCQTARAIVSASLPEHLSEPQRRVQLLLRFYGAEMEAEWREVVTARILGE